jgi:hypothetical protein
MSLIMPIGKYKDCPIKQVPSFYLIRLYMSNPEVMEKNPAVKEYIETHCAGLLSIGDPIQPTLCDSFKVSFVDKEAADKELKRIRKDPRKHRKPVRSYKCERCGLYHHTSRP